MLCSAQFCQPQGRGREYLYFLEPAHGSECHSEYLDLPLRDQTELFWSQIDTKYKRFSVALLQCRIMRVGMSQCLNGGGGGRVTNDQGTNLGRP
jgi:hypothetical protein